MQVVLDWLISLQQKHALADCSLEYGLAETNTTTQAQLRHMERPQSVKL